MITSLALVAGGLGALARFELGGRVQRGTEGTYPWGTTAVNLSGALALGFVVGVGAGGILSSHWVRIAGTGFLGGYTTFSTWMVETVQLAREGRGGRRAALVNVLGMLVVGVAAAGLGVWLAGRV